MYCIRSNINSLCILSAETAGSKSTGGGEDNYYTRPTTYQYKSLKNLSEGNYAPSAGAGGDIPSSVPVYTPSAMQAMPSSNSATATKPMSYSRHMNGAEGGTQAINNTTSSANAVAVTDVSSHVGGAHAGHSTDVDTSSYNLRQSSVTSSPTKNHHPQPGGGGRCDPDTGMYPSPTHADRNQYGTGQGMAVSSYDLRGIADQNTSHATADSYNSQNMNSGSSRPYTAAPGQVINRRD